MKAIFKLFATSIFLHSFLCADQGISRVNDYQKNSQLQWDWATESLKNFSFNSNDTVLDVGCGDGKITALIAEQIPLGLVMGMDVSEQMIHHAKLNFKGGNLTFFQGNAVAIPFKEHFDCLVSFCALHWVLDQEFALQSMKECLKSNGKMLLVLPGKSPNNLAPIAEFVARSAKWSPYFPLFERQRVYYTADRYLELLDKVRLEVLSIVEHESTTFFKNKSCLIAWVTPLINFADHLPIELQQSFVSDIVEQMLILNPPCEDGSILMRDIKLEVIATKPALAKTSYNCLAGDS